MANNTKIINNILILKVNMVVINQVVVVYNQKLAMKCDEASERQSLNVRAPIVWG